MNLKLGFLGIFMSLSIFVGGQSKSNNIRDFESKTGAQVTVHRATQVPMFVRFSTFQSLPLNGATTQAKVGNFSAIYGDLFGSKNLMEKLQLIRSTKDTYDFQHLTYQQYHEGVPVYDGVLRFHFDKNRMLRSINGVHVPYIKVDHVPSITSQNATSVALQRVAKQYGISEGDLASQKETLYIYREGLAQGVPGDNFLVYEVVVMSENGIREFVFINAHDGSIVDQFSGNHGALCRRIFDQNTSDTLWNEGDAIDGSLSQWELNEIHASGHSYYFFFNAFNRDSYDGAGGKMEVISNRPNGCPNASWNGVRTSFCTGTSSDDVVAHEWGHAVTEFTSNLIYAWQAGALNESYSDIWGETIDLINGYEDDGEDLSNRSGCGSSLKWRMGEDASAFGGAIRDMWDPTCQGDPGKVSDAEYHCSSSDNGGVHSNSGVNNHAYSLLVDGGTYNGQTITGLGLTKAAHIFWRANAEYLTATSDFSVQADALEMACTDLIGANLEGLSTSPTPAGPSGQVISAADLTELQKVLLAVEMRTLPDCDFAPLLEEDSLLCSNSLPDLAIFHEDFEDGLGDWTVDTAETSHATWEDRNWEVVSTLPGGRQGSAAFGVDPINGDCDTDLQSGILRLQSPVINIPGGITGEMEMAFEHYVATEPNWDGANIKYKIDDGIWTLLPGTAFSVNGYVGAINGGSNDNPMAGELAFTGTDEGSVSGSWGTSLLNLTSIGLDPGESIQFRFEMGTDGCNGRVGWYIDDISIFSCADCEPSVAIAETREDQGILFEAGTDIVTGDTLHGSSHIVYSAGQEVLLQAGFEVNQGAIMEAKIDGCDVPASPPLDSNNQSRQAIRHRQTNLLQTISKKSE